MRETSDRFGRLIKTELQIATNDFRKTWFGTYDSANRLISAEDDRNYVTQYAYDRLGRLTQVTGAVPGEVYAYGYNRRGLLTGLTHPDQSVAAKTYDELGRLITATDPMNRTDTYKYDGNHNVIQSVEKSGQTFTFAYDNRNRLTSKAGPGSTISFSYRTDGVRLTMTDNGNRVTNYAYDSGTGELISITYPDGKTITYRYDNRGLRTQMTTPFGDTVGYTYDNNGRLTQVKWNGTGQTDYVYQNNGTGPLERIQQANGIHTLFEHDAVLRLDQVEHKSGSTLLNKYDYKYEATQASPTITGIDETIGASFTAYDFTYDAMNRLATSSQFDEVYTYDVQGNRQTLMSEWDRYAGTESASYTYDAWNRLTKAMLAGGAEVEYKYNGDNLLTERTENGVTTRYYYDGGHIVAEGTVQPNGTATEKASYLYGIGLEMREDAAGTKGFYLKNGHGDIVEVRSGAGSVLASYRYDVWGNPISETGSYPNPFRYSGEYWDATVNLQYLRARWYDPSIGRFITEDSYQGELNNPLTLNLYTYTANNPLRYIDPSGHCFSPIMGGGQYCDQWMEIAEKTGFAAFFDGLLNYAGPGTAVKSASIYAAQNGKTIWTVAKTGAGKAINVVKRWFARAESKTLNIGAGNNPIQGTINIDIRAGEGIDLVADANKLPYADATIDAIIMQSPYNYYPLASEAARVLKQDGLLTVTGSYSNKFFREVWDASPDVLRSYGFELVERGPVSEALSVSYTGNGMLINPSTLKQITLRRIEVK